MSLLSPYCQHGHKPGPEEEHRIRYHLEPEVTTHPLAQEVCSNEIYQGHVHQDARREAVKDALRHKGPWAVRVVEGGNGGPHPDPCWSRKGKEACHDHGRGGLELSLGDAAPQRKALEELVEREGSNQGSDCARALRHPKGQADNHRV